MMRNTRTRHYFFAGLLLALPALHAVAQNATWDGGGADDNWSTPENWLGDTAAPSPAQYIYLAGTNRLTPVVDAPWGMLGLVVETNAGAFVLGGQDLTWTNGTSAAGGPHVFIHRGFSPLVIDNNINLGTKSGAPRKQFILTNSAVVTFNGNITALNTNAGSNEIWLRGTAAGSGGGADLIGTIDGFINIGGNQLVKADGSTWVIGNNSNIWGNTQLYHTGVLRIAVSDALPTNTTVIYNSAGPARLDLYGFSQTIRGIQSLTDGGIVKGSPVGSTLVVDTGASSSSNRVVLEENVHLVKRGSGALALHGVSTSTGGVEVAEGILRIGRGGRLANHAANGFVVNAGATLALAATNAISTGLGTACVTPVTLAGGTLKGEGAESRLGPIALNGGTILLDGGSALNGSLYLPDTVTVVGAVASVITNTATPNGAIALGAGTTFDVADVTADAGADLVVHAPFWNRATGSGAGGFTKTGAGTMTLHGAHPYTGSTLVAAGRLALAAGATAAGSAFIGTDVGATLDVSAVSGYSVATGQTLGGAGTVTGAVAVAAGGKLTGGTPGTAGTLTIDGAVTLNQGATNLLDLTSATTVGGGVNDLLVVNGDLAPGGSTIALNILSPLVTGTYRLFNYTGTKTGSFSPAVVGDPARDVLTIDEGTAGEINLNVVAGTPQSLRWTGAVSAEWNTATSNWVDAATGTVTDRYYQLDSVLFNDQAAGNFDVIVPANVQPGTIVVSNEVSTYSMSGPGAIGGAAGLAKHGAGRLTLSTTNSYTGVTTIAGGILKIGVKGALGNRSGGTVVTNGGTLDLNGIQNNDGDALTISGSGLNNTGAVINTGASQIQALQTVRLAGDALLGVWTSRFDIRSNDAPASLELDGHTLTVAGHGFMYVLDGYCTNAGDIVIAGTLGFARVVVSGPGTIFVQQGGTNWVWGNEGATPLLMTKPLQLNGGTLYHDNSSPTVVGSPVLLTTNSVVNNPHLGTLLILTNTISGPAGLTKSGAGTLVLSASNTFTGTTLVPNDNATKLILDSAGGHAIAGPVQIGHLTNGGSHAVLITSNDNQFAAGVSIRFGGSPGDYAYLRLMGTTQYVDTINTDDNGGSILDNAFDENGVDSDGVLVVTGAGTSTWSGNWMRDRTGTSTSTGRLKIVNDGAGALTLAGAGPIVTYSGGVEARDGTLNLKANGCAGFGTITLSGGTLALDGAGLKEGYTNGAAMDIVSPNPLNTGVKLGTPRANLNSDFGTSITWAYTGFLVVTGNAPVTYTFAESMDNAAYLSIGGVVVLNNTDAFTPTIGTVTLSPGLHALDLRVWNNASGSGGPFIASWWTNTSLGIGIDVQGRGLSDQSVYAPLVDAGDGLFLCTDVTITNDVVLATDAEIKVSNAIGPTNTLAGTIQDGGSGYGITKTGLGILRMAGVNTYGGPTAVDAGMLLVDGFHLGAGAVSVQAGGVLWGTGAVVHATVTVESDGTIGVPPGVAAAGTFNVTNLVLNDGAVVSALLNGTNPTVHVAGDLTVNPTVAMKLVPVAPVSVGAHVLIDYDGAFTGVAGDFDLETLPNGAQGYLTNNLVNTSIDLVITNAGAGIKWFGSVDAEWNIGATANWKSIADDTATVFSLFDYVTFDDTATGSFAVNVAQAVSVSSLVVSNEMQDYVIGGAAIGGVAGLYKSGAAKLTVNNANAFTGATVVAGGTLAILSDASLGAVPGAPATNHLVLADGATLEMLGVTTINANRLMSIGPTNGAGGVTLAVASNAAATLAVALGDASSASTCTVTKAGSGTLVLTKYNTYRGGTFVEDGMVQINVVGGTGASAMPPGRPVTLRNNSTLRLVGTTAIGQGTANPSVVTVDVSRVTTVPNTHQDLGDMVLSGGFISSEGAGDQYGNYICDGNFKVLAHADASIIDADSINIRGQYSGSAPVTFDVQDGAAARDLLITARIIDFPMTPNRLIKSGDGTMTLAGAADTNSWSGYTLITGGTLMVGTNGLSGTLGRGPVTNNARLVLNLLSGVVSNYIGGTGVVVQTGSGVTVLTAASDYSGGTQISNGTLQVSGAIGAGPVTIAAGATLGGTGSVGGAVTSDGSVAPGASAGTLTLSAGYTQNAGGSLDIELGGTSQGISYDYLSVGGTATLGGALNVTFINGFTGTVGDVYVVLNAGVGVSGTFASTNLPALPGGATWDVQYVGTFVMLTINSGTPPAGYDLFAGQIPNPVDRGYQNDPDGDGYANLLEYVTGGDPTNSDVVARMNAARTNGLLALKFTRNTNAVDATLLVEASYATTNNATWTGIATNLAGSWGGAPNVLESGTNTPLSVTVADTAPAATNRFLRLRVTRP